MPENEQDLWTEAMNNESQALIRLKCFEIVNQAKAAGRQIVPCTWALKRKRKPDGSLLKYKARLCIRGDRMTEGLREGESVHNSDGYAPVVEWGTVRLLLTLSIHHSLYTCQADFNNAFVQAPLERPIYMAMPPGLAGTPKYADKVLELRQSLYGHKYAAKLFYDLYHSSNR